MNSQAPVLVSGLHAVDNPSPGVSVARCLKMAGLSVVGLYYEPTDTGVYMDSLFERVLRMPRIESDPEAYLARLATIADHTGATLFIPTLDPEVMFLAAQTGRLAEMGLRTLLPEISSANQATKWEIEKVGRAAGFRVPKTHYVSSQEQAIDVAMRMGFPLMVKGAWYEAYRICYADEIPAVYRSLAKRWGLPVLLQTEVIGSEVVAACLCDPPGQLARYISMRKFGMSEQGTTWCGVTFHNSVFQEACARLLDALQWHGPCEVEAKLDESSGMLTLLEVNMRFPSWVGITPDVGSNLPYDLVRILRGDPLEPDSGFRSGMLMVRQHIDLTVPMSRFVDAAVGGRLDG